MAEVIEKAARRVETLTPARVGIAEEKRQDWVADAVEGTTLEDVLEPSYWAHVAADMKPMARIEVRVDTGEWLAELLVINCGKNWAQVHLLQHYGLVTRAETQPAADKYRVDWKGPHLKFVVVRLADSEVVQKGLASRQAASDWITNFEKA